MRTIPRIVVAVVALMLMAPAAAADQGKGSGDGRPSAVPAVNVSGSTGGELVGDWYAQNLALPADRSPFGGAANLCLNLGRHGRVLSPAAGLPDENGNLEMKCSVEVGRPVLMVMTSADCSSAEPPPFSGRTAREQRACAVNSLNKLDIRSITISIDAAAPVDIHTPRFFAVSPQRRVVFPAGPVFDANPGPATFVAAAWIAEIRGMQRGHHVVIGTLNIALDGQPATFPFTVHFLVGGSDHD